MSLEQSSGQGDASSAERFVPQAGTVIEPGSAEAMLLKGIIDIQPTQSVPSFEQPVPPPGNASRAASLWAAILEAKRREGPSEQFKADMEAIRESKRKADIASDTIFIR